MITERIKFLSILFLVGFAMTNCKKEGPTGPQGPQGPAGDPANYAIGEYQITAEDFNFNYVEIGVDIITEDIMDEGVVLVYVMDEFGFWNNVPSNWTPIIGYSYYWEPNAGGILGIDHDPDVNPTDYTVRVVTMFQRDHQEFPNEEILQNYESLIKHLSEQ